MGNAFIWYYPEPVTGSVRAIDLGEGFSDLQRTPIVDQAVSRSILGNHFTTRFSAGSQVRLTDNDFTDAGLSFNLQAWANHMQSGGTCSFAEDIDKAVAGYLINNPAQGDQDVVIDFRPWDAYNPSAALASPDVVVLQSPSPRYKYETQQIGGGSGDAFALAAGTRFDFTEERWVLFRHRGFWPLMRLPIDQRNQRIITHTHRISWTLDVVLEEHISALELFFNLQAEVQTDGSDGGITLEEEGTGKLIGTRQQAT